MPSATAPSPTRPLDGPRHAVGFLTRVPVPFGPDEAPRLAAAAPWFPLVGGGVGAASGGVLALAALLPGAEGAGVAAALGLAAEAGQLAPGFAADLALWDAEDVREIPYWYGDQRCLATWVRGVAAHARAEFSASAAG